jgi:hypothetical protein
MPDYRMKIESLSRFGRCQAYAPGTFVPSALPRVLPAFAGSRLIGSTSFRLMRRLRATKENPLGVVPSAAEESPRGGSDTLV